MTSGIRNSWAKLSTDLSDDQKWRIPAKVRWEVARMAFALLVKGESIEATLDAALSNVDKDTPQVPIDEVYLLFSAIVTAFADFLDADAIADIEQEFSAKMIELGLEPL